MGNGQIELQPAIQFALYAIAFVCFVAAGALRGDRVSSMRLNLVAVGLAVAIAPSVYIYFKLAFHSSAIFH